MQRLFLIAAALLVACPREIPVRQQSAVPPAPVKAPHAVYYYQGTNAADAVAQIRAKVGEPFRVLKIDIDDHSVSVQVQDPKKKENVDEYSIDRGVLGKPEPVRLIMVGGDDQKTLDANLFDPAEVDLAKIPDLIREADAKVELEGRTFDGVLIQRDMLSLKGAGEIHFNLHYSGTRKNGHVEADRHGQHMTVSIH